MQYIKITVGVYWDPEKKTIPLRVKCAWDGACGVDGIMDGAWDGACGVDGGVDD